MNTEEILTELFAELEEKAYDITWHKYYYKEANQIIRRHVEKIKNNVVVAPVGLDEQSEATVCPCCDSDKTYKTEAIHCNRCAVTTEI